jgi:hypothetical protein
MKRGREKLRALRVAVRAGGRAAIEADTVVIVAAKADMAAAAAGEGDFRTRTTASLRGSRANLAGRELL